jgi:hypothetical protein
MSQSGIINVTAIIGDPVTVSHGGTGRATLTDGAFIIGDSTNPVEMLGPGTNGQIPIGSTGSTAVLAVPTSTSGSITITAGAGTLNFEVASPTGFTWNTIAGTTQALANRNGYINANVGLTTFSLPVTAAVGDTFQILGQGAGGWTISQDAGQTIHVSGSSSTIGVGGSVASSNRRDCIELVCSVANTDFTAVDFVGALTIT